MNALAGLAASTGQWKGRKTLRDADYGIHEESASEMTVTPVARGRFFRLDYDWKFRGERQEGSLLVGHEPKSGELSGHWLDTWHTEHRVMTLAGTARKGDTLVLLGSYAAPHGPDWGWRIELTPTDGRLRLAMFNLAPDGREELAVAAIYSRA